MVAVFGLLLVLISACAAADAPASPATPAVPAAPPADNADNTAYPPERFAAIARAFDRVERLVLSRDFVGAASYLAHPEPWIRRHAQSMISTSLYLAKYPAEDIFRGFDPWERGADFAEWARKVRATLEANPPRRSPTDVPVAGTDKGEVEALDPAQEHGHHALLVGMADERMYRKGDKRAIYLLAAALDSKHQYVRAEALGWLLLHTNCKLWERAVVTEYSQGLFGESELFRRKKEQWLQWWRDNEKTYVAVPHDVPQ
jgi:hypothetical protein